MIDEYTAADLFVLVQHGLHLFSGLWLIVVFFMGGSIAVIDWIFETD